MDSYLQLAEEVLRVERRPLRARTMIALAYRQGIVPHHLHGRTQSKTMGARISEDIVAKRERSIFFRVAPGRFFLREFLTDASIPEEYRQPFFTRRRMRELLRGPVLVARDSDLSELSHSDVINPANLLKLLAKRYNRYDNHKDRQTESIFIWSFVLVKRQNSVLSYRLGRYRDDRDAFMSKRSIGFTSLVLENELTLFNMNNLGIIDAGVKAVTIDLDIPQVISEDRAENVANISYFLVNHTTSDMKDILAVIDYECPCWFEPLKRRLAISDLTWLDLHQPLNNIDDFDPWSKSVLLTYIHPTRDIALAISPDPRRAERRISEVATRHGGR
ncbi:MAG: winged helix-turn-helix domain-containing protein [Stellaceae bacterium]